MTALIVHNCVRVADPSHDVGLPGVPRDVIYVNDFSDPATSWWPKSPADLVNRMDQLIANYRRARRLVVPDGFNGLEIADHETTSPWYQIEMMIRRPAWLAEFARACRLAGVNEQTRYHELMDILIRALVTEGCDGVDDFPHQHSRVEGAQYADVYFDRGALWKLVRAVVLQNYWPNTWAREDARQSHQTNLATGRRCTAWNGARLIVTLSAHFNGEGRTLLPLDYWQQSIDTAAAAGAEINIWGGCEKPEQVEEHRRFMEVGGYRALERAGWRPGSTGTVSGNLSANPTTGNNG